MKKAKLKYKKFLTYEKLEGAKTKSTVVYIHGFGADMYGNKATQIQKFCKKKKISFLRFNLLGHGDSYGKLEDFGISDWIDNTLYMIDNFTKGNLILVGSSMGGWMMMIAAILRKGRVKGLVGIAPAPDFTDWFGELIEKNQQINVRKDLEEKGFFLQPREEEGEYFKITQEFIDDANKNLILKNEEVFVDCPIRIIQGMLDTSVPYVLSLEIANKVTSQDVRISMIKDGDHRLSRDCDIPIILCNIEELVHITKN
ncbi:alpha/beta hydrolase [Pseudomonadota bacterium]